MANEERQLPRLGRGLSALLGENRLNLEVEKESSSGVKTVPIGNLSPGKFQPRRTFDESEIQSLANSIRERGILQPILVRPAGPNAFEIIAGERRWRAAQIARIHDVPVLVKEIPDEVVLEAALVENIQRSDLKPLEESGGYRRLMDEFGYTQEKVSQVIGKSRSHIANMLRLESLPFAVKKLLDEGKLTAGHARPLVGNPNAEALAMEIVSKGLSVRKAEALAARRAPGYKGNASSARELSSPKDPNIIALENSLSEFLGLVVTVDFQGEKGKVSIHCKSLEQLDDIINRLRPPDLN